MGQLKRCQTCRKLSFNRGCHHEVAIYCKPCFLKHFRSCTGCSGCRSINPEHDAQLDPGSSNPVKKGDPETTSPEYGELPTAESYNSVKSDLPDPDSKPKDFGEALARKFGFVRSLVDSYEGQGSFAVYEYVP